MASRRARRPARPRPWNEYAAAAAIALVPTAIGLGLRAAEAELSTIDAAMLYLLGVVVAASRYRQGPATLTSLLSIALFDFFFVQPYYTFSFHDARYGLTFAVMLLVALVMSRLTARIRSQAEASRERERRTATLYAMSRDLSSARTSDELEAIVLKHLHDTFAADIVLLLPDASGRLQPVEPPAYPIDDREIGVAQWTYDQRQPAGHGTSTLPAAVALYVPLAVSDRSVGVIGIRPAERHQFRDPGQRRLLEALAGQAAVAFERLALAERSRRTEVAVEAERLRATLLSSLSHDLRTPLAAIEGAGTTLLQADGPSDAGARRELAGTIVQESQRMSRLVANLLDMVRVETGALEVQREWQPLSDVAGVALIRTEEQLEGRRVTTDFPPYLPLVPVDEVLLEQVFVNLLENAAKHTPPGTPVDIIAEEGSRRSDRHGRRPGSGRARRRGGAGVRQVPARRQHGAERAWASVSPSAAASSPRTAAASGSSAVRVAGRCSASPFHHRHPADPRSRANGDRARLDSANAPLLLLIEDEPQMRRFLRAALGAQDYRLVEATTAREGLAQAASRNPDVILLDLGLPDRDGLEVTRELREWSGVPDHRALGPRTGSRTRWRRSTSAPTTTSPSRSGSRSCSRASGWRCGTRRSRRARPPEPVFEAATCGWTWRGGRCGAAGRRCISPRPNTSCSTLLIRHAGKVLTHRQLLKDVWGVNYAGQSHYVRVYMAQLRQKLEDDPARPRLLITEPGVGYRLRAE